MMLMFHQDLLPGVRPVFAFWFLMVCPGMAYAPLLRLRNWLFELMLGLGLSLSVVTIVALVMLYQHTWAAASALNFLTAWCLLGALLQLITGWRAGKAPRRWRSQPRTEAKDSALRTFDSTVMAGVGTLLTRLAGYRALLTNAGSMVGTTAVTSGLGFVYWWLAARLFSAESVGLAAAMISAMMLLATVSVMGLGTVLIGELPRRSTRRANLIVLAGFCAGGIGLILGASFAVLAHRIVPELSVLSHNPLWSGAFMLGVSSTALTLLLDNAFIGLLRGHLQLWRNAIQAAAKVILLLGALLIPLGWSWQSIYLAWVLSGLLSLAILIRPHYLSSFFRAALQPEWRSFHVIGRASFSHFAFNLTLQTPTLILPLLVTTLLSAAVNASFYVAYTLAAVSFIIPAALTSVLHAIGAGQPELLSRQLRFSLKLSFLGAIAVNAVILPGAEQVLGVFGASYAQEAAWCLRIFTLSIVPVIIKTHYVAICRITNRVRNGLWLTGAGAMLELVFAYFGGQSAGLTGLSWGWFAAMLLQAALMCGVVVKALHSAPAPASPALAQ
jgi:O-antigen/teichoic acid export membrane protein